MITEPLVGGPCSWSSWLQGSFVGSLRSRGSQLTISFSGSGKPEIELTNFTIRYLSCWVAMPYWSVLLSGGFWLCCFSLSTTRTRSRLSTILAPPSLQKPSANTFLIRNVSLSIKMSLKTWHWEFWILQFCCLELIIIDISFVYNGVKLVTNVLYPLNLSFYNVQIS